mgnify:CR=1 FL=1|tara:strand:- start:153 stop:572 length:420 start_codon:yes stop_codon:yes gene_type:complete
MMKKSADWEQKTHEHIAKYKQTGFAWGKWDCVRFTDAYIRSVTGVSAIPKGINWKDEKSALEAILELGDNFPTTIKNVLKKNKLKIVKKEYAQVGDIVLFKEHEHLLGIYDGFTIQAVTENGLVSKPLQLAKYIWRING